MKPKQKKHPARQRPAGTLLSEKKGFLAVITITILGCLVYANSLGGEFIWDDTFLIENNLYVRGLSYLPNIFTGSMAAGAQTESNFYRPIQIFTYLIDYSLWELNVVGYHLTNILLHISVALCICWVTAILFDDWFLSFLASALYVVHPIHTESISYISGRADSLAAVFMLLCFIFYIKNLKNNNKGFYILMIASYCLALLSRENSLILVAVLPLYHYYFCAKDEFASGEKQKPSKKNFLSLSIIAFAYIVLRLTLLKHILSHVEHTTTVLQRLPGFFVAITNYIRLLVLPVNLHMEYGNKLFSILELKAIIGIVILASLLFIAFRCRTTNRLVAFSISWFLVTLLPHSNLYPINAYMAEHWLYVPSIGFFLVAAKFLTYLYKTKGLKSLAMALLVALLSFYSYLTVKQNTYWGKPIDFYERTLRFAPESSGIYNNLGLAYRARGENTQALKLFRKAVTLDPRYADAHNNLGITLKEQGRIDEAIKHYLEALRINPDYEKALNNLGIALKKQGRIDEAIKHYLGALRINPDSAETHYNLGNALEEQGRIDGAIKHYLEALRINPDHEDAHNNLGIALFRKGHMSAAITHFREALRIRPDYVDAKNNLNKALMIQRKGN